VERGVRRPGRFGGLLRRNRAGTAPEHGAEGADGADGASPTDADVASVDLLEELSAAFGEGDGTAGGRAGSADAGVPDRRTVVIGGDDEPDIAYLDDVDVARGAEPAAPEGSAPEGSASEGSARRGTVFIDDDGSDDAVRVEPAASPGMEPRMRQRRIRVKREAGRRRLRRFALVVGVVGVVVGVLAVLGSSLFSVDDVVVSGAVYTDPDRLAAVVDDLDGTPVLLVDTARLERELERIPWVESARVRTAFPDRATVELRERTPVVSMAGSDGRFRVLDAEGRVLDSIEGQPIAVVLIAGVGALDIAPGEFAPVGPSAAASLVTKLTPEIRQRLDSMVVTPDGTDLRLVVSNGEAPPIEVRFGSAVGDNDQIEKLVRLARQLDDLGDEPVRVIDVSTSDVGVS
jgi:cell division protein FtsQ